MESAIMKKESFFTPKRMSRMAILIALSGVGAFVKIPTPTGDMGLDSAPGYFAGLVKKWDWKEAQIIGIFARLMAAAVVGFPLGLPVQICWGIFLGSCMGIYSRMARIKLGMVAAIVAAILTNGVIFSLVIIPASYMVTGGMTLQAAIAGGVAAVLGVSVASGIACAIGVAAHQVLAKTNVVK